MGTFSTPVSPVVSMLGVLSRRRDGTGISGFHMTATSQQKMNAPHQCACIPNRFWNDLPMCALMCKLVSKSAPNVSYTCTFKLVIGGL